MRNEYGKVRRLDAVRMKNRIVSFFLIKNNLTEYLSKGMEEN